MGVVMLLWLYREMKCSLVKSEIGLSADVRCAICDVRFNFGTCLAHPSHIPYLISHIRHSDFVLRICRPKAERFRIPMGCYLKGGSSGPELFTNGPGWRHFAPVYAVNIDINSLLQYG